MTTRTAAETLRAKLKAALANKEKLAAEAAELERAAKWAEGNERRERLAAVGRDAEHLAADHAGPTLAAALADITSAIRRARQIAADHNAAVGELRARATADGAKDMTPPSPDAAYVALRPGGIAVRDTEIHTLNADALVNEAVAAGRHPDQTAPTPRITSQARELTGRFWALPNGTVMAWASDTAPGHGCREITRAEYLAGVWGLDLRDLPAEVLDQLTDLERAQLAPQLLPADG